MSLQMRLSLGVRSYVKPVFVSTVSVVQYQHDMKACL